ncbi:MAG: hypothetical protein GF372_08030 [Candidatus Marinimicrobia bacterium]|nr:hypothetical protein [Candidatus Neomarinimicrobiota bacterium]
MNSKLLIFPIVLLCISSCEGNLIQSNVSESNIDNFEVFWHEFDQNYSYFTYKNVDWDSVYTRYRPLITENLTEQQFFNILAEISFLLKDGHVNVISPFGWASYHRYREYAAPTSNWVGVDVIQDNYVPDMSDFARIIFYGTLKSHDIGYIWLSNFSASEVVYRNIDTILDNFKNYRAVIVDVRNNGGGSNANSSLISGRFTDERFLAEKVRYRNGPDHDDFSEWISGYIQPAGPDPFLKPVAVLTNRNTASSAEQFVLEMRVLPHVTVIGDSTAGSSGNPLVKELPNGWICWISNWQSVTPEMKFYEDIGLAPDIPIWLTPEDSAAGQDVILEQAVSMLTE